MAAARHIHGSGRAPLPINQHSFAAKVAQDRGGRAAAAAAAAAPLGAVLRQALHQILQGRRHLGCLCGAQQRRGRHLDASRPRATCSMRAGGGRRRRVSPGQGDAATATGLARGAVPAPPCPVPGRRRAQAQPQQQPTSNERVGLGHDLLELLQQLRGEPVRRALQAQHRQQQAP